MIPDGQKTIEICGVTLTSNTVPEDPHCDHKWDTSLGGFRVEVQEYKQYLAIATGKESFARVSYCGTDPVGFGGTLPEVLSKVEFYIAEKVAQIEHLRTWAANRT